VIILAIDTSNEYLSLALEVDGVRFSSLDKVLNKQSHYIIEKINTLVIDAGIKLTEINLIAYVEGPGSFTGLRVGLSVALGIAYGINAKLVAIPSFAIYARASGVKTNILVGIDARLNQIYLSGVNPKTLDYFITPCVIDPDRIECGNDVTLIGNGFSVYNNLLSSQIKALNYIEIDYPSATHMLDIVGLDKYKIIALNEANLMYLRNKVALSLIEQKKN
jgi:tRNA threonylcarbamoyladenosine biosynthesis protein TsaB